MLYKKQRSIISIRLPWTKFIVSRTERSTVRLKYDRDNTFVPLLLPLRKEKLEEKDNLVTTPYLGILWTNKFLYFNNIPMKKTSLTSLCVLQYYTLILPIKH